MASQKINEPDDPVERLIQLLHSGAESQLTDEMLVGLDKNQERELRELHEVALRLQRARPPGDQAAIDSASMRSDTTPADTQAIRFTDSVALKKIAHYEILETVAGGGFGVVLKARDTKLGRVVALKIPQLETLLLGPEARQRFAREARLVAMLSHPAIVPVYETGADGQILFIASAYCNGGTLGQWFRERDRNVDPRLAARIVARLCEAVQHAHVRGVVHRDLKPGNVLLHFDDGDAEQTDESQLVSALRITDFGLARFVAGDQQLTRAGATIGTPAYMSPEQARGAVDEIGAAADIYALGAIFYELLTGQLPIPGESNMATMRAIENQSPISPQRHNAQVPGDLAAICLKCLEKDPRLRYPTCQALADDLNRHLTGRPIVARSIGRTEKLWRWCRRNPALSLALGALACSLTIGLAVILWQQLQTESLSNELVARNDQIERARIDRDRLSARNRNLIKQYLFVLDDTRLLTGPGKAAAREHLLSVADRYLEEIIEENPQDPESILDRSRTLAGLARLKFTLGETKSQQIYAQQAIEYLTPVATHHSATALDLEAMAYSHWLLAKASGSQSKIANAMKHHEKALQWQRRAIQRQPEARASMARLANYMTTYSWLLYSWHGYSPQVARDSFRPPLEQALEIFHDISSLPPTHDRLTDGAVCTALLLNGLSKIGYVDQGTAEPSDRSLIQSVDLIEQSRNHALEAIEAFPDVLAFEMHPAACDFKLGQIYSLAGDEQQADQHYQSALEQYRNLTLKWPNAYSLNQARVDCLTSFVGNLCRRRDFRRCTEIANAHLEQLADQIEKFADQNNWLLARKAKLHYYLGVAARSQGQRDKAEEYLSSAIEIGDSVRSSEFPMPGFETQHAWALSELGLNQYWRAMNAGVAPDLACSELLIDAIAGLHEAFLQDETIELRTQLCSCLRAVGITLGRNGDYRNGAQYLERSADFAITLRHRTRGAFDRGLAALWLGDYKAIPDRLDLSSRLYLNQGVSAWKQMVHAAGLLKVLSSESHRSESELKEVREILLEYAVSRLNMAADNAYFESADHAAQLKHSRQLDPLREDPRIQEILAKLLRN